MKIVLHEAQRFWTDDPEMWVVLNNDPFAGELAVGKTRRIALRRAERALEKALDRVRKMLAKEEAK